MSDNGVWQWNVAVEYSDGVWREWHGGFWQWNMAVEYSDGMLGGNGIGDGGKVMLSTRNIAMEFWKVARKVATKFCK